MRKIEPILSPSNFVGIDGITHLCSGGESPWLKCQEEVYELFARNKSLSYQGRDTLLDHVESCRQKMGQLWNVDAERVSFMASAAEGMNWLARGLDWRKGDNIVTTSLEFPSVAYAWKNLTELGVEIRPVPHRNWQVFETELLEAIDERTRILAVSQVSFYSGQNLDIKALAAGLEGSETLLAVDATHASGAITVPAHVTDLCVSSSYKWLLATHGTAPCYLSEKAESVTRTTTFGWRNLDAHGHGSAERKMSVAEYPMPEKLEAGNPAMATIMFLERSLDLLLEVGIERIESHVRDLAEIITTGLEQLGIQVISPTVRASRSGNTCFLDAHSEVTRRSLEANRVLVWGELGRVRISGHLYNSSDDVERLLESLSTVLRANENIG